MKKFLCLILVLSLSVSVIVGCANNGANVQEFGKDVAETHSENDTAPTKEESPSVDEAQSKQDSKNTTDSKNTEQTVDKKDTSTPSSSDFYLILNGTNEESVLYHKGDCPLLKGKEIQKTSWEMIEMLQFRHCAKCNPPKYKGYVE